MTHATGMADVRGDRAFSVATFTAATASSSTLNFFSTLAAAQEIEAGFGKRRPHGERQITAA
jgi:hypothetical protein